MNLKPQAFLAPVLNSYSALFFSQNKVLATLLLLASFLNPVAGLSGLVCVLFSLGVARVTGFNRDSMAAGLYSFNNLLVGIAFGTFYRLNSAYWIWLLVACLCTTILTLVLSALLGKYNLPVLSLPFGFIMWAILLSLHAYPAMGMEQRISSLMNELGAISQTPIDRLSRWLQNISCPEFPALFFRALSSIIFQDSVATGMLIAVGLFIHSRIAFCLLLLGFFSACLFNSLTGVFPDGISHYHLGANFMMTSSAIGGVFLIPSWRSYLWSAIGMPVAFLVVVSLSGVMETWHLPVFSLPFSITTIGLLYFFMLRAYPGKLHLTPLQHYSPEKNLYRFISRGERLFELSYLKINLPFMGSWTVSQGHDGDITHKGDWGKALDFVVTDTDGQTYRQPGNQPEHYYCYNKPVLACAEGLVEEVVAHIEDNAIGDVNTRQNWGNSVVIKHTTGLYSKVSHLKKGSVKVKPGDYVRQGDVIAMCGNSGRSPEPHLHFQVQATPYIGSRTISYPFAYYVRSGQKQADKFCSFRVPAEGEILSSLPLNRQLKQALALPPGYTATVTGSNGTLEHWDVFTDAYNSSYLYCRESGAAAWFIQNGTVFYFTQYTGPKNTLLYAFYLAAFKVILSSEPGISAADNYPLDHGAAKPLQWLNDLVAPFGSFISNDFTSETIETGNGITIRSQAHEVTGRSRTLLMQAELRVAGDSLESFTITYKGKTIHATWTPGN